MKLRVTLAAGDAVADVDLNDKNGEARIVSRNQQIWWKGLFVQAPLSMVPYKVKFEKLGQ